MHSLIASSGYWGISGFSIRLTGNVRYMSDTCPICLYQLIIPPFFLPTGIKDALLYQLFQIAVRRLLRDIWFETLIVPDGYLPFSLEELEIGSLSVIERSDHFF